LHILFLYDGVGLELNSRGVVGVENWVTLKAGLESKRISIVLALGRLDVEEGVEINLHRATAYADLLAARY
jgi:hypothetical protein